MEVQSQRIQNPRPANANVPIWSCHTAPEYGNRKETPFSKLWRLDNSVLARPSTGTKCPTHGATKKPCGHARRLVSLTRMVLAFHQDRCTKRKSTGATQREDSPTVLSLNTALDLWLGVGPHCSLFSADQSMEDTSELNSTIQYAGSHAIALPRCRGHRRRWQSPAGAKKPAGGLTCPPASAIL